MKQTFILCSVIAFTGAIVNMVLTTSGEKNISKIISSLIGIILLLAFFKNSFYEDFSKVTYDFQAEENTQLSQNIMENVIKDSEVEIKKQIQASFKKQFNVSPIDISIKINRETLEVDNLTFFLARSEMFISAFEIKEFIKSKFEIEAEVYFV